MESDEMLYTTAAVIQPYIFSSYPAVYIHGLRVKLEDQYFHSPFGLVKIPIISMKYQVIEPRNTLV